MGASDDVTTLRADLARAHATIAMLREALTDAQRPWEALLAAKAALAGVCDPAETEGPPAGKNQRGVQ